MCNYKKLIFLLFSLVLINAEESSFRGKNKEEVLGSRIPLSFSNMVSENYKILPSQLNAHRGSYLIIAPDGVVNYLGDFVSFKKSQGFDVYLVALSEAGETANEIKETIETTLEEDPMLEYVLLIGDVDGFSELPSFYYGPENDVTDQKYTYIYGDDNVPDVFIGRLSIDSLSDLAVIMSKTINYVRNPLQYNSDWLSRGIVVAGNYSNTYPIPVTPKWTSYWLRDELIDYGYSQVDTVFYPPIQQGASYIIPLINNGAGIVNYRGWGDANGWHYPEFHVDDVNDLNNGWLTPVFMSYVCNSNDFANNVDPCLAEAIIRGGTPTVPKGGVAFIGPSDLHTSTKYNNVINAYMYDAMLNHGIVELGPAMQAGQSGLLKEFPAQSGPGEAQEFYSHVYNILGDPSLQVYLDTPNEFTINVQNILKSDGFLEIQINDQRGNLVPYAVLSIMSNSDIISKGLTDEQGKFVTSLDISSVESFDIYANKSAFIQGHKTISVNSEVSDIILTNFYYESAEGFSTISYGSSININFEIKNISTTADVNSFEGSLSFSEWVEPSSPIVISVPQLAPEESINFNNIMIKAYKADVGNSVIGLLKNASGNIIAKIAIEHEPIIFGMDFQDTPQPGESFSPTLILNNYSGSEYEDIQIKISPVSEGVSIELNDTDFMSSISAHNTSTHPTNYNIELSEVSYGSNITLLVELTKNEVTLFSKEVSLFINPNSSNYPVAPNNFGYWAYDDTDVNYEHRPTFDWVELDPDYGGQNGTHHQLDDDDHVDLELPFTFQYHGVEYNEITVNSNGWASFVPCNIDYFWNMSIPMYMGPKALLAPFSDDLETLDTNGDGENDIWINVYTWFDQDNGRYIIEWSRALNGYDEVTEETFEIILHSQNSITTQSGDGVIDFQYLEIADVDVTKNYSTVGIESPEKNYGLQYAFNNVYAPGAAILEDQRAIRFTTEAPINYVAPLSIEDKLIFDSYRLNPSYPNPFNPSTNLGLSISKTEYGKLYIIDILGREVKMIHNGTLVPGSYTFTWNGKSNSGNMLASGAYFLVANYGQKIQVQKLLLMK